VPDPEDVDLSKLSEPEEIRIIKHLNSFPSVVAESALALEPHRITYYLTDLAGMLHSYYNRFRFINEDDTELTRARLCMAQACKNIIGTGLGLAGVSAPERM
jgi:arginyl-tRNA synthetase